LKSQVMPHTLSCLYRNDRQVGNWYRITAELDQITAY